MRIGQRIMESGLLVRRGGGFALKSDRGGIIALDLVRTPVDHVEKRVHISGVYVGEDLLEVETLLPIDR